MLLLPAVTCENIHLAYHQVACSSGESFPKMTSALSFDSEPKNVVVGFTRNSQKNPGLLS